MKNAQMSRYIVYVSCVFSVFLLFRFCLVAYFSIYFGKSLRIRWWSHLFLYTLSKDFQTTNKHFRIKFLNDLRVNLFFGFFILFLRQKWVPIKRKFYQRAFHLAIVRCLEARLLLWTNNMNYYFPFRSVCRHKRDLTIQHLIQRKTSQNAIQKNNIKKKHTKQSCRTVALFDLNSIRCVLLWMIKLNNCIVSHNYMRHILPFVSHNIQHWTAF